MTNRRFSLPILGAGLFGLALLTAACLGTAQSTPTLPTATKGPPLPPEQRYELVACPYDVPWGPIIECGYLTVPENRSDPNSRDIRLAVAVVKSTSDDPRPDPIVYLSGGPGGSTIERLTRMYDGFFAPLSAERDVVLFDQRGVGESRPALDCPGLDNAFLESVQRDIRREQLQSLFTASLTACKRDLDAAGVDLSAYNSAESAADLNDLRQALGIEEWNLYGISYGTRLALTVMRDYPQNIRSVILDSSYPPQADLYSELLANADRAFGELFAGCAADAACNAAYPELERIFFEVVDGLNYQPADLEVYHYAMDKTIEAKMNGDLFLRAIFSQLYSTGSLPFLPALIYSAHGGDTERLTPLLGDLFFTHDTVSIGMHYSVECREEFPFGSAEGYLASIEEYPDFRHGLDMPIIDICELWDVPPADAIENEPVTSDIPTLVLAGEYDPITPPRWGEQVAQDLSQGYYFAFPGVGHGASLADICPAQITFDFLSDPTVRPDSSCIAGMNGPYFFTEP